MLLPSLPPGEDQACRFQDSEVAHDPKASHLRKVCLELEERLAIALEKPVQQEPPAGVGEGLEDPVVCHAQGV